MEQAMEMQVNQEQASQSSDNDEVAQAAALPPAAEPAPQAEKPLSEKIREKGNVAPPVEPAAAAAAAIEAYKANYKFKAAGKEHEIPEFLRGAIKDADSEKYLHSVFSKAHGLEMVQSKLKEVRDDREQIRGAYNEVMQPIQYAREAYGRDDLDTVFSTLKMDPNKILQWAYNKVQLSQMPADQRQVYEARSQAEKRAWELEQQNAQYQQSSMQAQSEQISQMLEVVLERPDFGAVAQAYDTRRGKAGAFKNLVVQMGDNEFTRSGKVISPMEAAKAAVELLGEKLQMPAAPAAIAAPAAPATPAEPVQPPKITLPNAGGAKASAPGKSKIRSLDDIRKVHQQMASK